MFRNSYGVFVYVKSHVVAMDECLRKGGMVRFWNSSFRRNFEEEVYFLGVGVWEMRGELFVGFLFQAFGRHGLA